MSRPAIRGHQVHDAEPPRIVERHRHARRHREHDVIVTVVEVSVPIARARGDRRGFFDAKPAGHSEVHDQRVARRQLAEQVLAAARQRSHAPPPQPTGEAARKRLPQIAPIELDAIEARARHRRFEGPAHAFDFRQLRHGLDNRRSGGQERSFSKDKSPDLLASCRKTPQARALPYSASRRLQAFSACGSL